VARSAGRESSAAAAAIGWRPHSGWAAVVAMAGTADAPAVADRRRIALAGSGVPKQPYHAAENLGLEKARERLLGWERATARLASRGLTRAVSDLRANGHEVVGCGMLLASGRPLPPLAAILGSHALIHTADGEHFRDAIRRAAAKARLPLVEAREKEIWERAGEVVGRPASRLRREIDALGKPLGPPWTADEKLAALVAWMSLAAGRG
jgi:hypothetical protein